MRGFIISKNRHGVEEQFPLLTMSIAGLTNRESQTIYELSENATKVKKQCKQLLGSNYLIQY